MSASPRFARLVGLFPRHLAAMAALAAIGWAFAGVFAEETPLGRVRGRVMLPDTKKPLSKVEILLISANSNDEGNTIRRTHSNEKGEFSLAHVPVGSYHLTASSEAHTTRNILLGVAEGKTEQQDIILERSQAEIALTQHQRVFATKEMPHLSIQGYVDGKKPARTDTVRMRLFRTRLSTVLTSQKAVQALESLHRGYEDPTELPKALMKPQGVSAPTLLTDREVRITQDDREGFYYQKINFDKLPTGLYLLDIKHAKASLCSWFLVTDTALVMKQSGVQTLAFAVDMETGTPLPDVEVRAYRNGRILAQNRTDIRGISELTLPVKRRKPASLSADTGDEGDDSEDSGDEEATDTGHTLLVALRGNDEAVIKNDRFVREENANLTLHAYTDRPIYRPGQRIYFKGIAREKQEANTRSSQKMPPDTWEQYRVPPGLPVSVEVRDPSGEKVYEKRLTTNRAGSFADSFDLREEAPTGVYSMMLLANGSRHTHDIVIASYRKPEFNVTVTPKKPYFVRGEPVQMEVNGKFYFGSPVAGAKVTYTAYANPSWAEEFPAEYEYDGSEDRLPRYWRENEYFGERLREGKSILDENGHLTLAYLSGEKEKADETDPPPTRRRSIEALPQVEDVTFSVTVKDSAKREVTVEGEARIVAGDFRLTISPEGYVAMPGHPTNVTLSAINHSGKPVPNVSITLETGYQRWQKKEYAFQTSGTQQAVTGPDGRVTVAVIPPRAGNFVLKATAKDGAGRMLQGRSELWTVDDTGGDLGTEYTDLSLLTDKRRYNPGETARALINTARVGQTVLLTIEGDRVYHSEVVPIRLRSTVVRIPIRAEYGPNVFLSASYVQKKRYASSETPLRVFVPQRELKVTITADKDKANASTLPNASPVLARYRPGEPITYRVKTTDATGKAVPAEFSMGVVDEAIYALREDDPTALRDAFYPKRFNRVNTLFSFSVQYLGDADKAEPQITARKRFPDTAFWQPFLQTDASGQATVQFALPDNLTTWRATVTAHSADTRLGGTTGKIITSKEFFVRLEKPRFLTQHDSSQIIAVVHNETDRKQTAMVRLRAEGLLVTNDIVQTLTLEAGKYGQVAWPVAAPNPGTAKLRVTAWTPKEAGQQYTDGVETSLPVRPHGREQYATFAGQVGTTPQTHSLTLEPQALLAQSRLTVRISPSLISSLLGAVDYLIEFPYGCAEQTTSRFLADLMVQRILRRNAVPDVNGAKRLPRLVRAGLQRLYQMQNRANGGWGWFEHDGSDPWITAYVLMGLGIAQEEGYPVSKNVLARGQKAAKVLLAGLKSPEQPFLLYALALTGDRATVRTFRSKIQMKELTAEGLAYLALTDRLLGQTPDALPLLLKKAIVKNSACFWKEEKTDSHNVSDQTATAAGLRVLLASNPGDPRIGQTLLWLMRQRTGEYWHSTRDTTAVLAALCDYLARFPATTPEGQVVVRVNGQAVNTLTLTSQNRQEKEIVLRIPAATLRSGQNTVAVERVGSSSPVFYSVQLRQTVAADPLLPLATPQFSVQREYLKVVSKKTANGGWRLDTEPTNNRLKVGDQVRVRLTINIPQRLDHVLIEDAFPSGLEVLERGNSGDEIVEWGYWWSAVDVRDDRIAFFARTLKPGRHVIEYNMRAQTPGQFRALPMLLQPMYAPAIRAETGETQVEVYP